MAATALHAEPVRVVLDRTALEDLGRRLRATRLAPDADGTWARGTPGGWLTGLVADWQAFDPLGLQARLDQLTHLRVEVDGISVHLVHAPGTAAGSMPLLLTHGWPSSFLEYGKLLPLLTDPAANGGTAADAFTVVAPSLPGFGFSGPPPAGGLVHERVAELWYRIMTDALGYRRFVAHGSDLGAGVTAWLARAHPEAVAAIHLATPGLAAPPPPWSDALTEHFREVEAWSAEEGGYAHMHATKPATIGAALDDSPVALAAWVGEKLTQWSSTAADGQPALDRDHLLSTLTLYWATRTAASSLLPYWAYRHTPGSALPPDDPAPTPTAIDIFGGEIIPFPKPPRELAERYFNVVRWAEHASGGHFPAVAEPQLLAGRLRAAFQPYRDTRTDFSGGVTPDRSEKSEKLSERTVVARPPQPFAAGAAAVRGHMLADMAIQRMDNVAIVVDDLDAAVAFFTELGMELEGKGQIEGLFADRTVGLDGVRSEIAMMRTPDGHGKLELTTYLAPAAVGAEPENPPPNTLGLHRVMFAVDDIHHTVARLRARGAELLGEVARYEDSFLLCYLRGPAGIIVALAEQIG